MNEMGHQILCVLLDYRYIAKDTRSIQYQIHLPNLSISHKINVTPFDFSSDSVMFRSHIMFVRPISLLHLVMEEVQINESIIPMFALAHPSSLICDSVELCQNTVRTAYVLLPLILGTSSF